MAGETADQLQATADKFIKDRPDGLNADQQASLDKLNARIAKARATEAAEATKSNETPTVTKYIQDVGTAALPNNNRGQTEGQFYDCPDDAAEFEAKHGYTLVWAFNDQLTKLLRPTEDSEAAASRQATALRFVRGEAPAEEYISIIGGNAKYLGCIVIADIHDLGAPGGVGA